MKVVLRFVDTSRTAQAGDIHEIETDVAVIPEVGDTVTIDVLDGEPLSRYVSGRSFIRYHADKILVEFEVDPLDDDEWAPSTD